jgi:hypothetical protein
LVSRHFHRESALKLIRKMTGAALAAIAAMALAQSPYEINGLHTELVFTEAVAQAEKLGGTCQVAAPGTQEGGTSAQCEFSPCSARNQNGACEPQEAQATGISIAAQPILRISLEAPENSARLTRIVFVYEGSRDTVAESLKLAFGQPSGDATPADAKSWSHSQRLNWTQGIYRMGLLDSPKLLILAADRAQE